MTELKARIGALTRNLLERARARWPHVELPTIETTYRLRGHCAGEACGRSHVANYNLELLERYGEDFVDRIVPHEVAHLVVARVYGRVKPHGPEWRDTMRFFGAEPSVTHDYETKPARRTRRVPYRCACPEHHLLTVRAHRRIVRGWVEYTCRVCRERLVHTG